MKTFTETVERRVENLAANIQALKDRMEKDFLYSFEWGVQDDIYKKIKEKHYLDRLLILLRDDLVTNSVMVSFVESEIKRCTEMLLFAKQFMNSSSSATNTAYLLDREVTSIYLKWLMEMIEQYSYNTKIVFKK